jgi:hypothetical protein
MAVSIHTIRNLLLLALSLVLLTFAPLPAAASKLSWLLRHADDAAPRRAGKAISSFDEVGAHLKTLPGPRRDRAIAVDATNEGHWRLRNAAGETFTAATPEELKRGLQVLAPIRPGDVTGHVLILTADALFKQSKELKVLSKDAELNALIDNHVYGLAQRVVDGQERYYLDAGGGVHVPITTREQVFEALWHLARPVDLTEIRVLALEPGATTILKRSPATAPAQGRLSIEAVDPERLPHMLNALVRGTVVISGRIAGPMLHYRPSSGPERTLPLDDLRKAAAANDINLVIVETASARQPGTRNWFWQRIDLARPAAASAKPTLKELVRRLTGGVDVEVQTGGIQPLRTGLMFSGLARGTGRGWTAPVGEAWRNVAPEVTGTLVANGLQLDLRSRVHQKELDQRIIPGISSGLQYAYIALFIFGAVGSTVSSGWWQRIWPLEQRGDYPRRAGYWAARTVRGTIFLLLFMPLVSVVSAPIAAVLSVWHMIQKLFAILTYPFRSRRAA